MILRSNSSAKEALAYNLKSVNEEIERRLNSKKEEYNKLHKYNRPAYPGYTEYDDNKLLILKSTGYQRSRLFLLIDEEQCFLDILMKQFPARSTEMVTQDKKLLDAYKTQMNRKFLILRMIARVFLVTELGIYRLLKLMKNYKNNQYVKDILNLQ